MTVIHQKYLIIVIFVFKIVLENKAISCSNCNWIIILWNLFGG